MIIECIKCNRKFEVNSDLIPSEGRNIQCGSCNHLWFFKNITLSKAHTSNTDNKIPFVENVLSQDIVQVERDISDTINEVEVPIKNSPNKIFSLSKFLSYIFIFILSLTALLLLVDTLKNPLNKIFPGLELILFNLYETMKDIVLFVKDLT